MLNSAPLNTWPLNALGGAGGSDPEDPPIDPIVVPHGHAFRWTATVTMGGIDVTELLTGSIRVDREEGAAGLAEFELFYPAGATVITDIVDRTVTIDYTTDDGQDATQVRLFTGLVAEPSWDAPARIMRITATDNLQHKVEAMPIAQIDLLTQGMWSEDVFAPLEGRSHWDYAQERMSTRAASLDCSALGVPRAYSWYASSAPHYIFGPDTTVYQSINVDLAQLRNVTNRVELEVAYRYPRLHDARQTFSWKHPGTGLNSGIGGFCNWRTMSSELPDKAMVISSTSSAGLTPVSASWYDLPPTMPDPCGTGQPWINNQVGLLLGAEWTGARRWSQAVTETYKLTLTTEAGQVEGQQIISRAGTSVNVDHPDSDGWSSSLNPITEIQAGSAPVGPVNPSYGPPGDRADEPRRVLALGCMLQIASTEVIEAHRKTTVSWSVPTSMALGVDLSHTVEINDQYTHARAKCSHRVDELNFETGSALTNITISVMRGGGVSDPLLVPDRLGANDTTGGGNGWDQQVQLATQLGGRFTSGEYDDDLDGFSGNYDAKQDNTLETFPRRLAITAKEISAELNDEKKHELERVYRVGISNDLLEL